MALVQISGSLAEPSAAPLQPPPRARALTVVESTPASSPFAVEGAGKEDHGGQPTPIAEPVEVRAACIADMRQVEPLINAFARRNLMLPKTHDQLARLFREFVVAVDAQGRVVGCGALRVYNEVLAEVASLAVDEAAHGSGLGRRLVERLMEDARALGLSTVFALTLKDGFFHKLGFRTVPRESFPLKVWADCRSCPKLHACDEIAVARDV